MLGSPSPGGSPSTFATSAWNSAKVLVDEHPASVTGEGYTEGHLILNRRAVVFMKVRPDSS